MAWNELSRVVLENRTLSGEYFDSGSDDSRGMWQIKYFAETVAEYEMVSTNKYRYKASVYVHITEVNAPGELYLYNRDDSTGEENLTRAAKISNGGLKGVYTNYHTDKYSCYTLTPGEEALDILFYEAYYDEYTMVNLYNFDGSFNFPINTDLCISIGTYITPLNRNISASEKVNYGEGVPGIPIHVGAQVLTANNFTDEENPSISYQTLSQRIGHDGGYYYSACYDYSGYYGETIDSVQITLSFDGTTPAIPYRDLSLLSATNYTFNLTDEEREMLRINAQGNDTVPIYFLTKTIRTLHYYPDGSDKSGYPPISQTFYEVTQRNFTIVGCNPTLNPTVKDIKPETLALTGDENTFIRYESMAEFAINAAASKHATIVSQSVTCGSKTVSNLPNGVIDDVESGTFIFNIVDSRSMGASSSVFKNLVEYVKPTCYQKAEVEIVGETGATIKLKVSGNYFNGSFGLTDNTLQFEVRRTDGNDNWGEWTTFAVNPTFNGITYELEATFTGLDYGRAYVFQSRITDKLNTVESAQYIVSMKPVFDWSDADFNFNVPVNVEADEVSMYGDTIIRHSFGSSNTVLSASDGNIYVRPKGTNNTSGETIFYGNGSVKFNGTVTFADGTTGGGDPLSALGDYVIEAGSDSMGSNGTWYWRKWLSGKAEAWGCRNFGRMAITTTWGNLYRSEIFTQDLPDNVFIRTPDAININIVHSNYGGWICKHEETAPSADTTGSFIFVRPASATATPTNIGFYIVGEWK